MDASFLLVLSPGFAPVPMHKITAEAEFRQSVNNGEVG